MLPLGVLINPSSGRGRGAAEGLKVLAELNSENINFIDLSGSSYEESLSNAKAAIAVGQIKGLLVVGGDGMSHLGVGLCANTIIPLGIIAAGTGNDSARALGLPIGNVVAATRAVIAQLDKPHRVDVLKATSTTGVFYTFGAVSAGFDALVNQRANELAFPKGPSRYQAAMLLELAKFKPIKYHAEVDGVARDFEAMLCTVTNAPAYGGGMLIVPTADIRDGELDLFIVHKLSRIELIKVFPKVYTGEHVSHPAVEIIRAKKVHLEAKNIPAYSDGESVGHAPITVEIAPEALLVFAPLR